MKVQICGPMWGIENANRIAFMKLANLLKSQGHTVTTPFDLTDILEAPPKTKIWHSCLNESIKSIADHEAVAVLPGWGKSLGSKAEVAAARAMGKVIFDHMGVILPKGLPTVLEEAQKIVDGLKQTQYGNPWNRWLLVSKLWTPIVGKEITPEKACLCMIGVKMARLAKGWHRDSAVDLAGYAYLLQKLHDEGD